MGKGEDRGLDVSTCLRDGNKGIVSKSTAVQACSDGTRKGPLGRRKQLDSAIRQLAVEWGAYLYGVADLTGLPPDIAEGPADIARGFREPFLWASC